MDVPSCSRCLCTHDTRSTRQDDTRSKAKLGSVCTCLLLGSEVVEDTSSVEDTRGNTLENTHPGSGVLDGPGIPFVLDGKRVRFSALVMWGLTHSCRGMVLKRVACGVLTCSLLHDNEPVWTKRGPTPLPRSFGEMSPLLI